MPLSHHRNKTAALWLALWLFGAPVAADTTLQTGHTRVRLLSEQPSIRPGDSFWLALQLTPEAGWHTYWKNPGDAGKATTVKWGLSPGLHAGGLRWPSPERIRTGSLVSYGYTGTVNLLTEINTTALPPGSTAIEITAAADWLVCEDICIPENGVLTLSLPLGPAGAAQPETTSLFNATRALLPKPVPWTAAYVYKDNELVFDVPLEAAGLTTLLFFPVEDNLIENSSNQSFLLGKNSVRISVGAGYLQQTGPFHGVLVWNRDNRMEAMEFTAHPVTGLPDLDFVNKSDNAP